MFLVPSSQALRYLLLTYHNILNTLKPIFHQAFFGRVGADNATDLALGTLQIIVSPYQKINFLKMFA